MLKSLVFSSMFIVDSSSGGGATSLRASRFIQPPVLVTRALSCSSAKKDLVPQLKAAAVRCMTGERVGHRDLLLQPDFLEVPDLVLHHDRADAQPQELLDQGSRSRSRNIWRTSATLSR